VGAGSYWGKNKGALAQKKSQGQHVGSPAFGFEKVAGKLEKVADELLAANG
jgi:hypothetical protein